MRQRRLAHLEDGPVPKAGAYELMEALSSYPQAAVEVTMGRLMRATNPVCGSDVDLVAHVLAATRTVLDARERSCWPPLGREARPCEPLSSLW